MRLGGSVRLFTEAELDLRPPYIPALPCAHRSHAVSHPKDASHLPALPVPNKFQMEMCPNGNGSLSSRVTVPFGARRRGTVNERRTAVARSPSLEPGAHQFRSILQAK